MTEGTRDADKIVNAILSNTKLTASVSLEVFRDVYNRIKQPAIVWIIVYFRDQAYAQPYGLTNIVLIINSNRKKYLARSDFEFIPDEELDCFGSYKGKYTFTRFVIDTLTVSNLFISLLSFLTISALLYFYSKSVAIVGICNAIVQAMSVFIAVFVTFVMNFDVISHKKYFKTGRLNVFVQSDKYIGMIAVFSIAFAILDVIVASTFELGKIDGLFWNGNKAVQSSLASLAISTAAASFLLMLRYHFERRHDIMNIEFARSTLIGQQDLFAKETSNSNTTERGRGEG